MSAERTPKETLEALRRMADEDDAREEAELDRIEAMSDAELEAYLKEQGADTKRVDANAEALYKRLHPTNGAAATKDAKPANVVPLRRRPVPRLVWLAAAALIILGTAYAARRPILRVLFHTEPAPPHVPTHAEKAHDLLNQAVDKCNALDWDACGKLCDAAYDEDSSIASDETFQLLHKAIAMSATDPKHPWFADKVRLHQQGLLPLPPAPKDKPTVPAPR